MQVIEPVFLVLLIVAIWSSLPALAGRFPGKLFLIVWSSFGVLVASGGLRRRLLANLSQDSLFTLEPLQQLVVVAAAASLMILGVWVALLAAKHLAARAERPAARGLRLIVNLLAVTASYVAISMLAPQLFYLYYRMLIPTLPMQWVIGSEGQARGIVEAIQLAQDASLAMTAQGAIFWIVIGATISVHTCHWRAARRSRLAS